MKFTFYTFRKSLLLPFILCAFLNIEAQITDPNEDINDPAASQTMLDDPFEYDVFYDVETGNYLIYKKIGEVHVGTPMVMTPEEFSEYSMKQAAKEYYLDKSNAKVELEREIEEEEERSLMRMNIDNKIFENVFGGNTIELIPQGYLSFDLGILSQRIDNPQILPQNRSNFTIDLQQRIQLSLIGKVGNNLQLQANYDTQSGFAFENRMNLAWRPPGIDDGIKGGDDHIIKNIEFGNVSMPLSTTLIQGPQALFGAKTELQFGRTYITSVFSDQRSEARQIAVQGGGLVSTFKVSALDYEENQHYFLGQYFRNHYDETLLNYPYLNTAINITRIEVWRIDIGNGNLQEQRALIGLRDLGEDNNNPNTRPRNDLNNIFNTVGALPGIENPETAFGAINNQILPSADGTNQVYNSSENFAYTTKAKLLNPSEFRLNPQLGFISLSQRLNDDQLLAVSFEYTVNGTNEAYKVGTFSNESSDVLKVKLLKHNASFDPDSPMWDLMMKNVYNLEGAQISRENFFLNVTYKEPGDGTLNFLPDPALNNEQLIQTVNWDRLNLNGDSTEGRGDGIFDFVEGLTIQSDQGRVYFMQVEPFGNSLAAQGVNNDFIFADLYNKQKADAQSSPLATRYNLEGRFQGAAGTGIPLGAINVPRGSVTVTSNGQELIEGVDYTVDYQMGRVQIINQALKDSGAAINISLENQSTFNLQRKRFIGLNVDHVFNDNLELGLTAVNYQERPVTQKAQYGVEPVKNTILGANLRYNKEAPYLTRLADGLPLVKTNAPSNISFNAEAAYLIPGLNNAVQNQSYIDDFEESATRISLKDPNAWMLASVPNATDVSPYGLENDQSSGYLRSLMSWYNIDPRFYGVGGSAPGGINNSSLSENMTRRVKVEEIYNNRDFVAGQQIYMNTFDVTIYPEYKGPYNNDNTPIFSNSDFEKEQRWAGITNNIRVTNFKQANIETLEFWVMDPYADLSAGESLGSEPTLYIQLGNVSEDVLRDGKLLYENGLSTENQANPIAQSQDWGVYPNNSPVLYSFDTEGEERRIQDAGFDGVLSSDFPTVNEFNVNEDGLFGNNLNNNPITTLTQRTDPGLDDFVFYNSDSWGAIPDAASDIRQRYRYFRNPEGNSPAASLEASSALPDAEDVNQDYNLDLTENYNQYTISLSRTDLETNDSGFIVDEKEVDVTFENGQSSTAKWYLFRVPLGQYDLGGSDNVLNNVRYMRMLMKGFNKTATLRFGTLDLLGNFWRKYDRNIYPDVQGNIDEGQDIVSTENIEVGSVDIESNGQGQPPYMLPPGIVREELAGTTGVTSQNEASLYMKILKLPDGDARGLFKNIQLDMRRYEELKFFVHAEDVSNPTNNQLDEDAKFFIRLGSDLNENYYEYEFPVKYTANTASAISEIWPDENNVSVPLDWFRGAKNERDQIDNNNIDYRYDQYDTGDNNKKVIIRGRPSMGSITTMMVGLRNTSPIQGDSKDVILWVNELRLYGMDNEGGYAANASVNFNLGDFATVSASGNYSSIGFGAIDAGPSLRNQEETKQYAVNTQVNVDKLLPEKWGVKIPFQYSMSETFIDPKYDPLDNDVEVKESPRKDEIQDVVRTYTNTKTFAVTNMRKNRVGNKKARFYDVENLTSSFLYSNEYYRDIYTQYNYKQNLRASLDYNYNFKSKGLQPFEKSGFVQDTAKAAEYLQWVKEFNFNLVPQRLNFKTEVIRNYNEFQFRDINALLNNIEGNMPVSYANNFVFGWQYNVGWNLAKSLKLDINSATRTLVDDIGTGLPDDKMIWNDFVRVGRPINYNHNIGLNYRLPFQYFPYIDFLSGELAYTGSYNWTANSTAMDITEDLGNLAQNANTKNATGSINFNTLYNKFKGYRKYDSIRSARNREIDSMSRVYAKNFEKKRKKKFKKYKFKHKYKGTDYVWGFFSMFKQAQLTYSETNSTALPGYLGEPDFFGYSTINGNSGAPTWSFLTGGQKDIRYRAWNEGWLTGSDALFQPYMNVHSKTFNMNVKIEPIKNLNVDFNFLRNEQRNLNQVGYNLNINAFENETAGFNSTIIATNTAFSASQEVYNDLLDNAKIISNRVAQQNGSTMVDANSDGYIDGYGLTNSSVLIPAFYSAFTGSNANKTKLGYKKGFPLPNWRISYTGLNNIPFFNYRFKNIELLHAYNSSYRVNGVQSSLDYYTDSNELDLNNNYKNYYNYNSVNMQESFSPLIGLALTFRNDMQISVNYNKDRFSILSLSNFTWQEDFSDEYVFGFSYILKDLTMKMRVNGKNKKFKSDLNLRADVSIRDTKTTIRRLIEDDLQITGGQKLVSIKFTADYNFGRNLNLALFYDQQVSSYKISTAYPLSITRAGLRVTFNFGR